MNTIISLLFMVLILLVGVFTKELRYNVLALVGLIIYILYSVFSWKTVHTNTVTGVHFCCIL